METKLNVADFLWQDIISLPLIVYKHKSLNSFSIPFSTFEFEQFGIFWKLSSSLACNSV